MKDAPMKQNAMRSIQPKVLRRVVVTIEGFVIRGGLERDGQYLVIKGARAEEAQKEIQSWLRKIEVLQ